MKMLQDISNLFPSNLFWDVDPVRLDIKEDMDLIIPRALYATTTATFDEDIRRLELFYSSDQITNTLKNTKERISNEVCDLVVTRYQIISFRQFESF
jgi:hypothetical protein